MHEVPSSAVLPAGTRLAHYEIVGLIGTGGMGQVYRARDTKLQRDFALKLLPADVTADAVRLPDGRRILYRAADPRTLDILDVESGASRRAFELPREVIGTLDISNDGREIVAVIVNRQADVVLAKLAPQ